MERSSRSAALVSSALLLVVVFAVLALSSSMAHASITRHYKFNVRLQKVRRLCHTKSILTVNGRFPGKAIVAREGDRVLIKVTNHAPSNNVSFHWHGAKQMRSGWSDGPAYITQCPIKTNNSYVYNYRFTGQRGTLWWHAHISWLRATMYGPIVILPRRNESYPFPRPHKEVTIMLGEWWNNDTQAVIAQALQTGAGPNSSDAYTFNGYPGPTYNSCTNGSNETYKLKVLPGKTYLLRIINAALNDDLFFSIANHTLTVVEADASYTKPYTTSTLFITPGQTTNVLLKTKPNPTTSTYLMAVRPYFTGSGTFDNTTAIAFLQYISTSAPTPPYLLSNATLTAMLPSLPVVNDTSYVANFTRSLRSLNSKTYPATVPQTVDRHFLFTVGLGTNPCPKNQTCKGPTNSTKFAASVNNISFALPSTALLQTYFTHNQRKLLLSSNGGVKGVFTTDFPSMPLTKFNYTGPSPNNTNVVNGTLPKLEVLRYNTSVELVLQGTGLVTAESHPLHLHGYNVFVVGQGFGNFDPSKDPKNYNLVDPVERNTVPVPAAGWVAVRFMADNPGVWFMHCHFDVHLSWGLTMAWLVLDGDQPNQKLPPPPADLPKC